jgi:hypothetical protein
MPFDHSLPEGDVQGWTSIAMLAIASLPLEERGPAAVALLSDCLTETLVASMFGIKSETLKKWRADGNGPPRTTEGNVVLFPIPLLKNYLRDRARGAHASQRPPRR